MPFNPNASRDYVNGYVAKALPDQVHDYPSFFSGLKLNVFRHIQNLQLEFVHPISVISGTNRSGKTTALMAIACSHYNFMRPNVNNGNLERTTWSSVVRFTSQDIQGHPWSYQVFYRTGNQFHSNMGSKNAASNKWSGVAKKSGQIGRPSNGLPNGGRTVIFIDLNRITPTRHLSKSYYDKFRNAPGVAFPNQAKVNMYLSYVLEDNYIVEEIAQAADIRILKFTTSSNYSSYNTASGEDVLASMLCQIEDAPEGALILIDEIEVGLHPKIQRRLMDVLYYISKEEHKQFIITSHSYAIIDSVPSVSRLFIDSSGGVFRCLSGLTTYETLTRMDSVAFPLVTVYVEDDVSKAIIQIAISEINVINPGFNRLIKVVIVGPANETYDYFVSRMALRDKEPYSSRPACVLDGDMKGKRKGDRSLCFPPQDGLFFHFSNYPPEKMLLKEFLSSHPHPVLQYHFDHSNVHCLFQKMVDESIVVDKREAFQICFSEYRKSPIADAHFTDLKDFLKNLCQ